MPVAKRLRGLWVDAVLLVLAISLFIPAVGVAQMAGFSLGITVTLLLALIAGLIYKAIRHGMHLYSPPAEREAKINGKIQTATVLSATPTGWLRGTYGRRIFEFELELKIEQTTLKIYPFLELLKAPDAGDTVQVKIHQHNPTVVVLV